MSKFSPQKILLDACVLYPVSVRDILLYTADFGMYMPIWSDDIQQEWTRNALKKAKKTTLKSLQSSVRAMNRTFIGANIENYEHHIPKLILPDPDDRHVLAAAIKGDANRIITFNLKDFPSDYVASFDIEVQHPDDFICELIELDENLVKEAFALQVSVLKKTPMTITEAITALEKNNMTKTGERLRAMFSN
jgi:predicted nucleic acid-binding protein